MPIEGLFTEIAKKAFICLRVTTTLRCPKPGSASCAAEGMVRLNAADFLMGILSSARFAQLARLRGVVCSVGFAFLGSGRPPDNNPDDCKFATLSDVRDAAFDASVVRKEELTPPVKEAFTDAAAAVFGC